MIKLIVTDVDGTLVEDGFTNVDPRLFDTILKLREKGIQFAVASGRPWASVERTFEPVKKKVFYISFFRAGRKNFTVFTTLDFSTAFLLPSQSIYSEIKPKCRSASLIASTFSGGQG